MKDVPCYSTDISSVSFCETVMRLVKVNVEASLQSDYAMYNKLLERENPCRSEKNRFDFCNAAIG